MQKIHNILLRLPDEEHKDFKIYAAKEGKTMNSVARELIREYILKKKAVA